MIVRCFLLVLLLAGCATSPRLEPTTSVAPGPPNGTPEEFRWTTEVSASAVEPAVLSFTTDRPLVSVKAVAWSDVSAFAAMRIEVEGCGDYEVPGSSVGSGSSFGQQDLCAELGAGTHQVRVIPDGAYRGSLTVSAIQEAHGGDGSSLA